MNSRPDRHGIDDCEDAVEDDADHPRLDVEVALTRAWHDLEELVPKFADVTRILQHNELVLQASSTKTVAVSGK